MTLTKEIEVNSIEDLKEVLWGSVVEDLDLLDEEEEEEFMTWLEYNWELMDSVNLTKVNDYLTYNDDWVQAIGYQDREDFLNAKW